MASSKALILALFITVKMVVPTVAVVYTVGDSSGWATGTDYTTWASSKTFLVGDSLVFNYGAGHTVDEVKESDYKSCTSGNSLTTDSSGKTTIALKTAGNHYFMCSVPGHCAGGMKVAVNVKASGQGSPTSGNGSSTTPATSTATNSSSSDSSIFPMVFMLIMSWISYCVLRLA